ncbi:THUMP domain-containing protein 3 [Zootermopsis nevadensis]|uniref:THUMP domain-containing protein 3 n=1 Tax=Zootermopsis nevadensis TaxID=136037 RepID=A0A067R4T5_ZOONE|nr:THUMP domain-containing protein 3 [Zootermopsis nevadensis]
MNIVEELRSVDNLYVVMKMVPSLHLSCIDFDHDINILQRQLEHGDIKKSLALWCERNKFQGIVYPTEDVYKVAKCDELEIKRLSKAMAETQIGHKKYHTVEICDESYENETCSVVTDNKDERSRFNVAVLEAYHETDSRKPEEKVLKFRVTCIRNGKHCFGSQDAAYHVGGRIQDMFHWIVDLNLYDLEIVMNIREE